MNAERLNDLDLLGPPRSCRRLPARTVLVAAVALLALVVVAIVWQVLA